MMDDNEDFTDDSGSNFSNDNLSGSESDSDDGSDDDDDTDFSECSYDSYEYLTDEDEVLSDTSVVDIDELQYLVNDAANNISPTKVPPPRSVFLARDDYDESSDEETTGRLGDVRMNLDGHFAGEVAVKQEKLDDEHPVDNVNPSPARTTRPSRQVGSIIHDFQIQNKVIWISFDIETGGPKCGIIQLSAVFYDHDGAVLGEYDSYCKPPRTAVFLPQACDCHGITSRNDTRLLGAPTVAEVWIDFCKVVEAMFESSDHTDNAGVLVAWNGKSCDLEWIYRLIHSHDECEMPPQIRYFMDPYQVIKKHQGCNLNPKKSKIPDLKLSTVYKYVAGTDLLNAHNSLFDCRAQGTVLMSTDYKKYQDMTTSICTIESVWSYKEKKRVKLQHELTAPTHDTWKSDEAAESWTLPDAKKFTGPSGGATPGPTAAVKKVLDGVTDPMAALALMFLFFVDIVMLRSVSDESNRYAYKDFVLEKQVKDADGKVKKKKILVPCDDSSPDKRKRVDKNKKDAWEFTPAYILSWLGICVYFGGLGSKQSPDVMWMDISNGGIYVPFVRNTMPKNAFRFVRQYIHFAHNTSRNGDPLYKIKKVISKISVKLNLAWKANIVLSVDESMIKYKGRSIKFVQYMPKKPIKHGIKVFCLCDAESGYLLAFEVYTGERSGSTWDIIERLIIQSGLQNETGRRLFMDNYYTTLKVVTKLYENHGWVCAGTVVQTKKKQEKREPSDYPFTKISKPATALVDRGWMRRATKTITPARGSPYKVQATVWKDKKIVGWLHSLEVGPEIGKARRRIKGHRSAVQFDAPMVQQKYATGFNGVDLSDKDSAKYSTSLRTNRWYSRVFFFTIGRAVHAVYIIVRALACDIFFPDWKKYKSKNNGRQEFQCHLGQLH